VDKTNVMLTMRLQDEQLRKINEIGSRIKVFDAEKLIRAEFHSKPEDEHNLTKERDQLDSMLQETEVAFMHLPPRNLVTRAPKLKWIQFTGAGIDRIFSAELRESSIMITSAKGVHATPIAEYVLGAMLMLARKALLSLENQRQRNWQLFVASELREKTLGVVGLGNIGREVARLATAFGMRVVATRRSAVNQESNVMGIDKVYPPSDLLDLISECDFVVLSPPITKETTKMIGEKELRAMKPTAYLINIARGGVIDQSVLVRALNENWIAGAALDVFEKEPLPQENELWLLPNVIVTSHTAGLSTMYWPRLTDLFCENLKRYLNGESLISMVDREKGY